MTSIHWLNAINGSFTNPSDWSGGTAPGASDDAILDAVGSTFTVTSSTNETVNSIQTAGNATLAITSGTFTAANATGLGGNGGTISVADGATFAVGGILNNAGAIELLAQGNAAVLALASGGVTLTGGGTLALNNYRTHNEIVSVGSAPSTLTNVDNTIWGNGTIGIGNGVGVDLVNEAQGFIGAGADSFQGLYVFSPTVSNTGTIESTDYGRITFENGTINNAGGILVADGHYSSINLGIEQLNGGTLSASGTGTCSSSQSTLNGSSTPIVIIGSFLTGNETTMEGAIVNEGLIYGFGGKHQPDGTISLRENMTISGGGTVEDMNFYALDIPNAEFINVDDKLLNIGNLGNGLMTFVNESDGELTNQNKKNTTAIGTGNNTIVNYGLIYADKGSISISSPIQNSGTLRAGATLTVSGVVTGSGKVIISGGTFYSMSYFNQKVSFNGGGVLELAISRSYTKNITGFSAAGSSAFDLRDIGFVSSSEATFSGTASGGIVTVTDGTHTAHINLIGNYTSSAFAASSDGLGGVDIVAMSAQTPSVAHFVGAMAAITGRGESAGLIGVRAVGEGRQFMLAAPRLALA